MARFSESLPRLGTCRQHVGLHRSEPSYPSGRGSRPASLRWGRRLPWPSTEPDKFHRLCTACLSRPLNIPKPDTQCALSNEAQHTFMPPGILPSQLAGPGARKGKGEGPGDTGVALAMQASTSLQHFIRLFWSPCSSFFYIPFLRYCRIKKKNC